MEKSDNFIFMSRSRILNLPLLKKYACFFKASPWIMHQYFHSWFLFWQSERPSMVLGYMLLGITVAVSVLVCLHRRLRNCPNFYQHQRIVSLKTLSSSFPAKNLWQNYMVIGFFEKHFMDDFYLIFFLYFHIYLLVFIILYEYDLFKVN